MPPPPFAVVCWNVDFTSPPQFTPDGLSAEYIAGCIETLLGESDTPVLLFLLECNVRHFNQGKYQCLDTALGKRGFSALTKVDVSTKECILIAVRRMTLVTAVPSAAWRVPYGAFEVSANALLSANSSRTTRSGTVSSPSVVPNTDLRDIAIAAIQLDDGTPTGTHLRVASMHAAAPGRGSRSTDSGGSGVKITEQHVSCVLASLLGNTDILIGDFNLAPNRTHVTKVNRTTIQATGFHSYNAFYTAELTTTGGHRYDHAYMVPGYVGTLRVLPDVGAAIKSVHDPIMLREIKWGSVEVPLPQLSTFVPYLGFGSGASSSSSALVPVRPPPPVIPSGFDFTSLFQLPQTTASPFTFSSAPLPPVSGLFSHGTRTSGLPRIPSQSVMMGSARQQVRRELSFRTARGLPSSSSDERALVGEAMLSLRRHASSTGRRLRLRDFAELMTRGHGRPVVGKIRNMKFLIRSRTESGYRVLQAQRFRNTDGGHVPFTGTIQNSFHFTLTPVLNPVFSRMLQAPEPEPVEQLPMDAEVVGITWEDMANNGGALLLTPGPVYFR